MNGSEPQRDVQASRSGLDLVGDAIAGMRIGEPQLARALLQPPWGLRFPAVGGAGVQVILKGTAWLLPPDDAEPMLLSAGDVALVRRRAPHGLADDPATPLWDASLAEHVPEEHWPADGSALDPAVGGTILIGGTYNLSGARPHPLLESLPDVLVLPARVGASYEVKAVVDLLGAEMDRDLPGMSAAMPALLDLLLLYALRAWFEGGTAPSGWAEAIRDPAVSAALRLIQQHPEQAWTVEVLARATHLSRAAFARRFAALTGQPPLTYLTWWRMTLAGRLLSTSNLPIQEIAGRVGYSTEFAFSKAFKRELGVSPSRFRSSRSSNGSASRRGA